MLGCHCGQVRHNSCYIKHGRETKRQAFYTFLLLTSPDERTTTAMFQQVTSRHGTAHHRLLHHHFNHTTMHATISPQHTIPLTVDSFFRFFHCFAKLESTTRNADILIITNTPSLSPTNASFRCRHTRLLRRQHHGLESTRLTSDRYGTTSRWSIGHYIPCRQAPVLYQGRCVHASMATWHWRWIRAQLADLLQAYGVHKHRFYDHRKCLMQSPSRLLIIHI